MLIGFYTIADTDEGILKVMRSYQYYAAVGIANIVAEKKSHWDDKKQLGGHVWHTTGSGKTMTSFKAAQLVAANHDADKVVSWLIEKNWEYSHLRSTAHLLQEQNLFRQRKIQIF